MSRIANYLQEHLDGEVTASLEARRYFATDSSILKLVPTVVVYPRNEEDVRKVLRFSWQLADRGTKLPVTARGAGTNTTGSAITKGILMVFGPHLDKLVSLDARHRHVTVEPGIAIDRLQQALVTHGLEAPALPLKTTGTIGGAIATNAGSNKSLKYGNTSRYAQRLRVVLANGEVIEAEPLDHKSLSHKMGLPTFEGSIYRELDSLLEENAKLIADTRQKLAGLSRNVAGYNLFDISANGTFSLVPLLAGSEGTLAITTEATLDLGSYSPHRTTCVVSLGRVSTLGRVLADIVKLVPAVCDLMTHSYLEMASNLSPGFIDQLVQPVSGGAHLLVEFDDDKESIQKSKASDLAQMVAAAGGSVQMAANPEEQDQFRRMFEVSSAVEVNSDMRSAPTPIADCAVPIDKFAIYLDKAIADHSAAGCDPAICGHAGEGIIYVRPPLDLSQLGDRQKLFKLQKLVQDSAIKLGGTTTATSGDGRLNGHKLDELYGKDLVAVMKRIKQIFDPHSILNSGVKFGTSERDVKAITANSYLPHGKFERFVS